MIAFMMAANRRALIALAALPLCSGCLARTAVNVATAPVRAASQGVDWATTSQSEADRNRGRNDRKRDERAKKLQRAYDRHNAQCLHGDEEACQKARLDYGELQDLGPARPAR